MKRKKINSLRILPISDDILKDRKFNIETFAKFQVESSVNNIDNQRYVRLSAINYTVWSKDIGMSINTFKKNIQMLILRGVLKKVKNEHGQMVYKICGEYEDVCVLFEERFIRKLLNVGSKNLIKIYLIYYKYNKEYGSCKLSQKTILEQIGFAYNSKNTAMLKDINDTLFNLGLINIERIYERVEGLEKASTRLILEITAPIYYETAFYKNETAIKK